MKKNRIRLAVLGAAVLAGAVAVAVAGLVPALSARSASDQPVPGRLVSNEHKKSDELHFHLVPSSAAIAKCIPHGRVDITVKLQTDAKGRDLFIVDAYDMPKNTSFTTFLLEVPGSPFGAAEYIGDVDTDKKGNAHAEFRLIVEEAFASTLVGGKRVRAELNHVGMWFADPAADDFCFGPGGGAVTPFDGDNEAGVQVMNSANALPGTPIP
jgi:hypothetical protein